MPEVTTPVSAVLAWLGRVSPDVASQALVGCGFHDGRSESLETTIIEAADAGQATVTLAGAPRPVSLRRFPHGEFVDTRPGAPLASAVAASRTPAELNDAAEQMALRRAGFDPGKLPSTDARRAVLAMVALDAAGTTPNELQRARFYDAVRSGGDAATARVAARLLAGVVQRFEQSGSTPEDLHWRCATLLRQAGEWRAAVKAADILYRQPGLRNETRLYLASTMAGSLLDLAGVRPTPALLGDAEGALKVVSELARDDEALQLMRRTLARLRGDVEGRS